MASVSSASAASGLLRIIAWAVLMVMPIATRRAWVPSWRSRSMRRSSAAEESRVSRRVCDRAAIRVRLVGPSAHRTKRLCSFTHQGARSSPVSRISRPGMGMKGAVVSFTGTNR